MAYLLQLNADYVPDDSCGWFSVAAYEQHCSREEVGRQLEKEVCEIKQPKHDKHYRNRTLY